LEKRHNSTIRIEGRGLLGSGKEKVAGTWELKVTGTRGNSYQFGEQSQVYC